MRQLSHSHSHSRSRSLPWRLGAVVTLFLLALGLTGAAGATLWRSLPVAAAGATVHVTIQNFAFSPRTVTVAPGTTIVWTQKDNVGHTVTSDTGAWPESALLAANDTFSVTLTKPGTYTYHCKPHPYMKGTIVVTAGSGTGATPMPASGNPMMGMMGPKSTARMPAWTGYYDGKKVLYLSTDTSSKAEAMAEHINYAPGLAKAAASASTIYLVTNGALAGRGPVFGSVPGADDYTPLWQEALVTWKDAATAVALNSDDQIKGLAKAGKLTLKMTGVVLNCPIVTGMTSAPGSSGSGSSGSSGSGSNGGGNDGGYGQGQGTGGNGSDG